MQNQPSSGVIFRLGLLSGLFMPMGLFLADINVTSGFMKILPRWVVNFGLLLAVAGEVSLLHLVFPKLLFLI